MTQSLENYLKALLAVCIGIALAFVVGSFMGTPVNPAESRQKQAKVDTAIQTGMVFQDGEAEAYLSVPSHTIPPFWVAVLDWHAWLLAPSLILAFLTLRPARSAEHTSELQSLMSISYALLCLKKNIKYKN